LVYFRLRKIYSFICCGLAFNESARSKHVNREQADDRADSPRRAKTSPYIFSPFPLDATAGDAIECLF